MPENQLTAEFSTSIVRAMAQVGAVKKNKDNPAFRSKYADVSAVLQAICPAFEENGIAVLMPLTSREGEVGCYISLVFGPTGEVYNSETFWVPFVKHDPQGYGSASTYARRFQATSFFCLPTEDDDGNKASKPTPPTVNRPVTTSVRPEVKPNPTTPTNTAAPKVTTQETVDSYLKKWDEVHKDNKDAPTRPLSADLLKIPYAQLGSMYAALGK